MSKTLRKPRRIVWWWSVQHQRRKMARFIALTVEHLFCFSIRNIFVAENGQKMTLEKVNARAKHHMLMRACEKVKQIQSQTLYARECKQKSKNMTKNVKNRLDVRKERKEQEE